LPEKRPKQQSKKPISIFKKTHYTDDWIIDTVVLLEIIKACYLYA